METLLTTIGYAVIGITLAGIAYAIVRIFTKLNSEDDD